VTDDVPPHSGSRWEPAGPPPATSAGAPFPGTPEEVAGPHPAEPSPRAVRRPRHRLALALAAVGLALVSALGGFALGHATAGQDGVRVGTAGATVPPGGGDRDGDHHRPDFGNGARPSGAPAPDGDHDGPSPDGNGGRGGEGNGTA
jgi:hypothetical protein